MYTDDILFSQNKGQRQGAGKIELSADSQQLNDFGFTCIPAGVTFYVTAYFPNLDGSELEMEIGEVGRTSSAIRISRSVLPLASVVRSDPGMVRVALSPAGESMEHTDFTIVFAPAGSPDSAVQPQSITLRYNTPPGEPLGVVSDSEGNLRLMAGETWDVVADTGDKGRDGYVFWAWPKGMTVVAGCDQRLPDCVSTFVLNGRAYTPAECAAGIVLQGDAGEEYDVYRLYVGYTSPVELYARDVECVSGPSLLSGMELVELSLDAAGGSFEGPDEQPVSFYHRPGAECNPADLPVPVMEGYAFGGWSVGDADRPLSLPFLLEEDVALTALWQNPATVGEVRDLQGLFDFEAGSIAVSWGRPYVLDAAGLRVVLLGEGVAQERLVGGDIGAVLFEGIERDTGEYLVAVTVIDSEGNESPGLRAAVSSNTESYDEVGNLQAIVSSGKIDFYWTSPPKEDISHILIACHDQDGQAVGDAHIVDKHERSASISIEDNWPKAFHFHTVDHDGGLSEGMSMYAIELEIDGNPDSIDGRMVVPSGSPRSSCLPDAPDRDGFVFGGWYADAALGEPYDASLPVLEASCLFAKWVAPDEAEGVGENPAGQMLPLDTEPD